MIDWLTFRAELPHSSPIIGGHVVSIDASGELEWQSSKRVRVEGSWQTGLQVRTYNHPAFGDLQYVEISGNPVKYFQGHNLWGTNDVPSLVVATLEAVSRKLGLEVPEYVRAAWRCGDVELTRVDITESFHLNSLGECLAWLRQAEQTAHLSHRGRGQLVKGSTLYFGKHSRRWSLKIYAKGQEILAKGHGQEAIEGLPSCLDWANRSLRCELVLRSMELKRRGLDRLQAWRHRDELPCGVTPDLLRDCLEGMTMTTVSGLSPDVLEGLQPALRGAYALWHSGVDLREVYPKRTYYRYRAVLLPHGVDIATVQPRSGASNVVPLFRVLEAKPAPIPDWAYGTPLYYEPPMAA
jgi:II/X family phage/plasmid replication protein